MFGGSGVFKTGEGAGRRSFFAIVAEILSECRRKAKKTELMYRCNMSFKQCTNYLDLILNAQLVMVENDGPRLLFRLSGKGKEFLKIYESLKDLMDSP